MAIKETIHANGFDISIYTNDFQNEFISLTDIAKYKSNDPNDVIKNWMRGRETIEFLGLWESLHNPDFKPVEFDGFIKNAGLHTFTLSVSEWVTKTKAIGMYVKKGKYGGTYAHRDIAFEFASSISPIFKLYLIKEFQRLKKIENKNSEWNIKRLLTKNNYLIHTDSIKNYILPNSKCYDKSWIKYAEEADILNVIIFKTTASDWRKLNPNISKNLNIRDFATINELTILSNLETHNSELIKEGKTKEERFDILSKIANYQLNILNSRDKIKLLATDKVH